MKYEEMSKEQQDAIKGYLLMALTVKTQEEKAYTDQFFRLLLVANGTGIALLATLMGALIRNAQQIVQLKTPMIIFLVGAFIAALVYLPLMTVANAATNNIATQVTNFFLNKTDIETIQGYGLSRAGRRVVMLLLFTSLILFVVGVAICIQILGRIS
jgi:glucan phosphoethanolaminetransferase (alkaline phosphatase superfamily)